MPPLRLFGGSREKAVIEKDDAASSPPASDVERNQKRPPKWSFGVLNDKETDEVPGSVLLLSKVNKRNEPLGLRHAPARRSISSLPDPFPPDSHHKSTDDELSTSRSPVHNQRTTKDGAIVLDPQPEESKNDPLNWSIWRRDAALISLGFYCMLGGGMTPILAAGFNNVANTYSVTTAKVALTTGLFMMGLGIGSVIMSPTAILFGKRPVYLFTAVLFIISCIWCALSPNLCSLIFARIFQGIAVSPVECLPSASIAEIYFLHERAYRLGIYTLLLLGGKNLMPLVSAAIIQTLDWQWVFYITATIVGFGGTLLFFFVPETFWDRTPRPRGHDKSHRPKLESNNSVGSIRKPMGMLFMKGGRTPPIIANDPHMVDAVVHSPGGHRKKEHVHFSDATDFAEEQGLQQASTSGTQEEGVDEEHISPYTRNRVARPKKPANLWRGPTDWDVASVQEDNPPAPTPELHNLESTYLQKYDQTSDYFGAAALKRPSNAGREPGLAPVAEADTAPSSSAQDRAPLDNDDDHEPLSPRLDLNETNDLSTHGDIQPVSRDEKASSPTRPKSRGKDVAYTDFYRTGPTKSYLDTLIPYHGRLVHDNWFRVALRPFILFAYPAVLWSATIYACSVGWLIVLSESVSDIYKNPDSYNFSALQTGLVYLSPFVAGILGTAVAGKVSDIIVRSMAKRNGGVYEPEFRLVMAIPMAISTTAGLMGFGWSAQNRDAWIVPTIFFGIVSFGCTLGSTTAITFCVDSYRQYAGEALVTLNFSKSELSSDLLELVSTNAD